MSIKLFALTALITLTAVSKCELLTRKQSNAMVQQKHLLVENQLYIRTKKCILF